PIRVTLILLSNAFLFSYTSTTEIYTLSLHDALPIYKYPLRHLRSHRQSQALPCKYVIDTALTIVCFALWRHRLRQVPENPDRPRSEEHTSELQSRENLVCRLLLEKKKKR